MEELDISDVSGLPPRAETEQLCRLRLTRREGPSGAELLVLKNYPRPGTVWVVSLTAERGEDRAAAADALVPAARAGGFTAPAGALPCGGGGARLLAQPVASGDLRADGDGVVMGRLT